MQARKRSIGCGLWKSEEIRHIASLCRRLSLALAFAWLCATSAFAQSSTTCTPGSPNCIDLYNSTIKAIQAYGYQPPGAGTVTNQSSPSYWAINSFTGGTLTSTPVSYQVPAGQGTPVSNTFYNKYFTNCLDSNPMPVTVEVPISVTNTSTITSSSSTTNTNESSLGGETSVTISYSPPGETGGTGVSGTQSFTYGTTNTTSTTDDMTNETSTGVQTGTDVTIQISVPYGNSVLVYGNDQMTQYSSIPWTSSVALTGNIYNTIYGERFQNTIPPDSVNPSINGSGIAANIWYPVKVWYSANSDILSSPNGTYAFFPNWTADLVGVYFTGINDAAIDYYQGEWYGTYGQGMNLRLDAGPCTGGCAGTFWATNPAGDIVTWDSNTSPAYIAMQDDGNFVGYNSSDKAIWSSNTTKGLVKPPTQTFTGLTPALLLGPSQLDFPASGTYTATTYGSQALVYVYPPIAADCSAFPTPTPPTPPTTVASGQSSMTVGSTKVTGAQSSKVAVTDGPATPPPTSQATPIRLKKVPRK